MFEIIDVLFGPLFRQNIFKYATSARYRLKLRKDLGKEPIYVFIYQVLFLLVALTMLVLLVAL